MALTQTQQGVLGQSEAASLKAGAQDRWASCWVEPTLVGRRVLAIKRGLEKAHNLRVTPADVLASSDVLLVGRRPAARAA